ncbi:hypothetical protein G6553_13880 [Nocardioides sp. IC4_145]|uniref:SatD family protein n=1 Tax=Nocardioides sp. IC4_145 TaxID=2714037 RepID=UPI00140E3083|nr:SatD family protein [Nocardioides sp. IC4_145]NHC24256.1 hypothetical protein [Nocardioides sp. IC4_145]
MVYTLIGDLVGSRRLTDRADAQRKVGAALARVERDIDTVQPLEPTVGDEFQGAFATVADAVLASLLVRLELRAVVDVRCGLGAGDVVVHDGSRRPLLQDGPGWWSAREALEVLGRPRRAASRTWYAGPEPGPVNAFLTTRDALVDRLNERACRMLLRSLRGAAQQQIAAEEGISKSAVSQAFARGVGALRDAHLVLGGE